MRWIQDGPDWQLGRQVVRPSGKSAGAGGMVVWMTRGWRVFWWFKGDLGIHEHTKYVKDLDRAKELVEQALRYKRNKASDG